MKWMLAVPVLLMPAIASPDVNDQLIDSITNLKNTFTQALQFENSRCAAGTKKSCYDALISTARIDLADAELAMHRFKNGVRDGSDLYDAVHKALDEIDDAEGAVKKVSDALNP